jgi:holo-[acyl-carrier protein] synthase
VHYAQIWLILESGDKVFDIGKRPLLRSQRDLSALRGFVIEVGVDVVEISRVAAAVARHGPGFRRRVYTELEWQQCGRSVASLAGRFAAKEAVMKALGIGGMRFRDIEIRRSSSGKPEVALEGRMQARAERLGVRRIIVSISHSRDNAVAVAVAERDDPPAGA